MSTDHAPETYGFTLTADDAADVLGTSGAEVVDLIREGMLPAFVWAPFPMAPLRFFLHPDVVTDYARRRRADILTADDTVRPAALKALRRYLADYPPTGDYDLALEKRLPLWGSTRSGRALHIRPADVVAAHDDPRVILTESALVNALERVRAVRVRGVVPLDDRGGKQRWSGWWRVPTSLLDGTDEDAAAADVLQGVVESGERLTRRAAGKPLLVES